MSWRPERGWVSLGARVGAGMGGAAVLALGLASGPGPLLLAMPEEAVEVQPRPLTPRASPLLIEQHQATVDDHPPASRAARVRTAPVSTAETTTVAPAPSPSPEEPQPVVQPPAPPPNPTVPDNASAGGREAPEDSDNSGSGSGGGDDASGSGSSGSGSGGGGDSGGGSGPG